MSDLHERCRKAEAEVAHLQRELTYAKNSFEAQKFLQHREWERAVQAERERDELRALLSDADERAHLAHGVAELAMKHRDAAERECDDLRALLRDFYERWQGEHLCNLKSYRHCESCQQFKARLDAALGGRDE